jgi:cytochrome c556
MLMKRLLAVSFLAALAFAQDHAALRQAMKTAGSSFGSLRKSVEAKDATATANAAEKLASVFPVVRSHFEEHKMQDGIDFASTAEKSSKALAEAAKAGDWDKASAELKTIGGTCQGCHAAHREKLPDGTYKMK